MADDSAFVFAGECTTVYEGSERENQRGEVVVLVKPDDTVLVHDADGYQPVAWLTRADAVECTSDEDGFVITATAGDERLEVVSHVRHGFSQYSVSSAGVSVGNCPDCGRSLVRTGGEVTCLGCETRYGLPRRAAVLEETCFCGLPTMRVERGEAFELCIDRSCESLDDAVRDRFDHEWDCPNCDGDLHILRRGGLIAGCEQYPDCDTGFAVPAGVVTDTCDCGLPVFSTANGRRCLDSTCERHRALSQ